MSDLRERMAGVRLYAVLTERFCRLPWRETAGRLLAGGADAIQLREKGLSDAELLARARALRELSEEAGALLIVNDRADVALIASADGVHLGQDDLPPLSARALVGLEMLIGVSTHSAEQARAVPERYVDYVGVGPFAPTATKGYAEGKGPDLVREVAAVVDLPRVAIGGITRDIAAEAVRAGASAVAACSALCGADDPEAAARELRAVVVEAAEGRKD